MAVAVILGLAFATVLTLIMVPTLYAYALLQDLRWRARGLLRRIRPTAAETGRPLAADAG